jgi:hypothetical protein
MRNTFHPCGAASAQAQLLEKQQTATEDECILDYVCGLLRIRVTRIIHECRHEAFETEAHRVRRSDDVAGIHAESGVGQLVCHSQL